MTFKVSVHPPSPLPSPQSYDRHMLDGVAWCLFPKAYLHMSALVKAGTWCTYMNYVQPFCVFQYARAYLLVVAQSAHHGCVYHPVQQHAQRVDVEGLVGLVLAGQGLDLTIL